MASIDKRSTSKRSVFGKFGAFLSIGIVLICCVLGLESMKRQRESRQKSRLSAYPYLERERSFTPLLEIRPPQAQRAVPEVQISGSDLLHLLDSPALPEIMSDASNLAATLEPADLLIKSPKARALLGPFGIRDHHSLIGILGCDERDSVREAMVKLFGFDSKDPSIEQKVGSVTWGDLFEKVVARVDPEKLKAWVLPADFLELPAQDNRLLRIISKRIGCEELHNIPTIISRERLSPDASIGLLLDRLSVSRTAELGEIVNNLSANEQLLTN